MRKLEATLNDLPRRRVMSEGANQLLAACGEDFQLAIETLIATQEIRSAAHRLREFRASLPVPAEMAVIA